MISIRRVVARLSVGVVGLGTLIVASPSAHAQVIGSSPRWLAWVGCWKAENPQAYDPSGPVVCVVPSTSQNAIDIATVDSGKLVSRYTVDGSGVQHSVNHDGCTGWEQSRWSSDSLRVYLNSEVTCNGLKRTSTGLMSISTKGEWVTVDAVTAGGNEAVRATHYREVEPPTQLPAEIGTAAALGRRMGQRTAAIAAAKQLTAGAIVEAVHALDTAAVQAWLVERNETYNLTAKNLVALADAGVPGSVTDVMIAATYPDEFHFTRLSAPTTMSELSPRDSARIAGEYLQNRCDPLSYYSPYGWGINPCSGYGYGYGSGYPGYRYGSGYGYGYGSYPGYGYGYGGYYGGYYTGPVVIVGNDTGNNGSSANGRAVKGQGYTRGGSSSGSSSGSSGASASSSPSSGSSSSSSSGSSSGSSAGSSSGSSSGRTAVARPPTH